MQVLGSVYRAIQRYKCCYSFFGIRQVLIPKSLYNGQKFTKLVSTKIPATASSMYAKMPDTTLK